MSWLDNISKKKEEEAQAKEKSLQERAEAAEKAAKEAQARIEALEEERQKEREQFSSLQSEFESIKKHLAEVETKAPKPPEEPADFDTDPAKAFQQGVAPIVQVTLHNAMQTARILAQQQLDDQDIINKTMDGRLFRAWSREIDALAQTYRPEQLGTPQAWLGLFYYVKGKHTDELADPDKRKKQYAFLEGASGAGKPPEPAGQKKPEELLTPEERRVAERMGVSPENYLKRKSQLKFANA
jgi:hypothetical protein